MMFARWKGWMTVHCILSICLWTGGAIGMSPMQLLDLRHEAEQMFYHGYDNYISKAFPEDELRPISCTPLVRDRAQPMHYELNDVLGNYSVTLIDNLSTLAILASSYSHRDIAQRSRASSAFQSAVSSLIAQYGDGSKGPAGVGARATGFDLDSKVQVFETVIRGVGGLISAHLFAVGELPGLEISTDREKVGKGLVWLNGFTYNGQLLRLAEDLARRLLPAFVTPTGLPYPRVNLRTGVSIYPNSPLNYNAETGQCPRIQPPRQELTETCSAGAGSLVLEFTTLSRLSGDPVFEQVAKRAFWSVWDRRSSIGLVGAGIDAETGLWASPYTGIGAGIDSFYEYAAKASILLSGSDLPFDLPPPTSENTDPIRLTQLVREDQQTSQAFAQSWQEAHAAIKHHLHRDSSHTHPHYVQGDLFTGAPRALWLDSLSAFYPGLLSTMGELEEAVEIHLLQTALWSRYSALPERWSVSSGGVEMGLGWWGGRPEFVESTYHLYQATKDPWYLHVGEMVLRDVKRRCWAKCGWAGIQDVRTGEQTDRMESFFLSETVKYLFLLFDVDHPLNKLDAPFVFSTEGHPLIIPRQKNESTFLSDSTRRSREINDAMCPVPPPMKPFSISATAARNDIYHAAKLARLHMMPDRDNIDSQLAEYADDHPSITLADVRSPSNYTHYPWTLPLELVPRNGMSARVKSPITFDITFSTLPNTILGRGALQRIANGIYINTMSGLKLGMIQDQIGAYDSFETIVSPYRVQTINGIALGRDEYVFVSKETAEAVVNPLDPNFSRIRDLAHLEIVVELAPLDLEVDPLTANSTTSSHNGESMVAMEATPAPTIILPVEDDGEIASSVRQALSLLLQQVGLLAATIEATTKETPAQAAPTATALEREYIPAMLASGIGAAPLPDFPDVPGRGLDGSTKGELAWSTIYLASDETCTEPLPSSVPRDHQIIILKRGGCAFSHKLRNIPPFVPSPTSLQLVIMISYPEGDDSPIDDPSFDDPVSDQNDNDIHQRPKRRTEPLFRPFLDTIQQTPHGLNRQTPIPLVLMAGGEETWELWRNRVKKVGIKRRYSIQAQGILVQNLVIL